MAALPKTGYQASGVHSFGVTPQHKAQNGGNPQGYGPLFSLVAGNWRVSMGVHGNGTIVLQNAAGAVLMSGSGGQLTLASPTTMQFVVTATNLDALTGSGGSIREDADVDNYPNSTRV